MMDRPIPSVLIKVDGVPLPSAAMNDVLDVSVNDKADAASQFTVRLNTWDQERQRVTWADSSLFSLGQKLEIAFGYVAGPLVPFIVGEVANLDLSFAPRSAP